MSLCFSRQFLVLHDIYYNISLFNITRIIEYIQKSPDEILLEEVVVNESHIGSVEVSKPIIVAEIAPGRYNLIVGHQRIEKARRLGIKVVRANKLNEFKLLPIKYSNCHFQLSI